MIRVTNEVPTYDEPAKTTMYVHSHWNRKNLLVLEVGSEKRTVNAEELKIAINNAINT